MSDKTEQPTARRLRKAREEGDSPVSGALIQAAAFVAALALAPAAIAATAAKAGELYRAALGESAQSFSALDFARDVMSLTLPMLLGAAAAAVALGVVQTGGTIALKKLAPDFTRQNPIEGVRRLFSAQRLLAVARALVGSLLVGWLAVRLLIERAPELAFSVGNAEGAALVAGKLTERLGWIAALVGLALAALDVVVTRRAWLERLMMTKEEVRREFRESEGDPEIKAARRRAHQEMLNQAAISAVKDATVLIVNPTHLATALRYLEDEDSAPRVVAQGSGDLAQRLIDAARSYGVPIVRDVPVARALSELEVGDEIPEALYEAVAEILRELWAAESEERS